MTNSLRYRVPQNTCFAISEFYGLFCSQKPWFICPAVWHQKRYENEWNYVCIFYHDDLQKIRPVIIWWYHEENTHFHTKTEHEKDSLFYSLCVCWVCFSYHFMFLQTDCDGMTLWKQPMDGWLGMLSPIFCISIFMMRPYLEFPAHSECLSLNDIESNHNQWTRMMPIHHLTIEFLRWFVFEIAFHARSLCDAHYLHFCVLFRSENSRNLSFDRWFEIGSGTFLCLPCTSSIIWWNIFDSECMMNVFIRWVLMMPFIVYLCRFWW